MENCIIFNDKSFHLSIQTTEIFLSMEGIKVTIGEHHHDYVFTINLL